MSAAGDKQIKFTFAVDQRSVEIARGAIRQLTSEVKTLVETMSRAGSSMQGLGGGMLGGVSAKSGGVNASQQSTVKGGSVLTQGIAADAKALSSLARSSTDALSQITRAMRSNFSGQVSEIERLKRQLGSLESQYERIQKVAGDARPGSPGASRAASLAVSNEMSRRMVQDQINGHMDVRAGFDSWSDYQSNPYVAPKRGVGGMWARMMNRAGSGAGAPGAGAADGNPFAGGASGMIMRALGIGGLAGGAILAGGAAGTAMIGKLGSAASASEMSNAQYNLDLGMRAGRNGARIGGSIGQLGMGIRGGDLASSIAMEHFATNGTFMSRGIGATAKDRIEGAMDSSGNRATFGDAWDQAWDFGGRKTYGSKGLKSRVSMKMDNAMAGMSAQMAEEMAEQVRNEIASKPQTASMYNAAYSSGFGNIGTARTGGLRLGVNPKTGNTYMAEFNQHALAAGYDPGSVASARASLGGTAGRGLMGAGQYMLGLQSGGFGNSDQMYGVGAQFGGGGARGANAFINAIQHQGIGGGGVDVTAGSQLASLVAGGMTGGNFSGSNGIAAMQAMMAVGATGTTGGDMRMGRVMGAGMGEYGRNLSGGTDPLQMGINTLAANASGATGWYAKKALMGLDPTQAMGIARSGELPQHLIDQGLTMAQFSKYNAFRNSMAFSRYIDEEGAGTAQGAAVAGVKGAGGLGNYMHAQGITARSKAGRSLISTLATARMATEGGSLEANEGALYAEIAGDKSLAPTLKSRGAGGPRIKGTIEGAVAEQEAKKAAEQGKFEAERYDKIRGSISRMVDNSNSMAGLTKDLVENTKTFDGALTALTASIMSSLQRLAPKEYARLTKEALDNAKKKGGAPKSDHGASGSW